MENLELFGQMLMKDVRDKSVEHANWIVDGTVKAPSRIELYKKIESCSEEQKEAIKTILRVGIDDCVFYLLDMLDQNPETFGIIVRGERKISLLHDEEDELHHALFDWFDNYGEFEHYI